MTRPRGSARRADAPYLRVDLQQAFDQLRREEAWAIRPRNAVKLLEQRGLKLLLVGLHKDATVESHRARGPISIHLLNGALRVTVGGEDLALAPGQVLTLAPDLEHGLRATEESALLLTIGGASPHLADR